MALIIIQGVIRNDIIFGKNLRIFSQKGLSIKRSLEEQYILVRPAKY